MARTPTAKTQEKKTPPEPIQTFMILCRLGSHWLIFTNSDGEQTYGTRLLANKQAAELSRVYDTKGNKQVWEGVQVIEVET